MAKSCSKSPHISPRRSITPKGRAPLIPPARLTRSPVCDGNHQHPATSDPLCGFSAHSDSDSVQSPPELPPAATRLRSFHVRAPQTVASRVLLGPPHPGAAKPPGLAWDASPGAHATRGDGAGTGSMGLERPAARRGPCANADCQSQPARPRMARMTGPLASAW
jgi:hypothetical protein